MHYMNNITSSILALTFTLITLPLNAFEPIPYNVFDWLEKNKMGAFVTKYSNDEQNKQLFVAILKSRLVQLNDEGDYAMPLGDLIRTNRSLHITNFPRGKQEFPIFDDYLQIYRVLDHVGNIVYRGERCSKECPFITEACSIVEQHIGNEALQDPVRYRTYAECRASIRQITRDEILFHKKMLTLLGETPEDLPAQAEYEIHCESAGCDVEHFVIGALVCVGGAYLLTKCSIL